MDLLDLYAKIALDTSEYERGVEGATKKSSKLQDAFKQGAQASETLKNKLNVLASQHAKAQKEVDRLTAAFNKSAKEKGVDSKETQDLAGKLREAEDNVSSIQKEMEDLTASTKKTGESFESSGGKLSGFADKLKNGLATAAKVGAAALAAASTAAAALTKISLESYADYEQLVGGVETLFGAGGKSIEEYAKSVGKSTDEVRGEYDALLSAQNTVLANASSAYKSAGLSANEYMETVTGFSASLIQSVGGDTARAAQLADQAIVDMSDNANKMGTAMESIQNAYQGFAKQNYTMLDNLKLGYGGTKEEMQRLLEDASKLPDALGRKFDISNYADIVEAIHLVQTQMGITGTTAEEADKTISGSLASTKAAWSNLLTGIADENADLESLIGNLVERVGTAANNLIPRIEQILGGIGELVSSLAPIIAERLPALIKEVGPGLVSAGAGLLVGLVQGVVSALPQLVEAVIQAVPALVDALREALPQLLEAGQQLLAWLGSGIMEGLPMLGEMAYTMMTNLGTYLRENLPTLLQSGLEMLVGLTGFLRENAGLLIDGALALIQSLAQGLMDSLPALLENVPTIVSNIAGIINDNAPKLLATAANLLGTLAMGLIHAIPDLLANLPRIIMAIADTITAFNWINLGSTVLKSIGKGIASMAGTLKNIMSGTFSGAVDFIKGLPGQALSWGKDMILGFAKGITSSIGSVISAVSNVASGIMSWLHFSRPDVGPLRDYESWMPDMMAGLAEGIEKNRGKVIAALDDLAAGMDAALSGLSMPAVAPLPTAASGAGGGVLTGGPVTVNFTINGAPGQDERTLAMAVQDILLNGVFQRRGALA